MRIEYNGWVIQLKETQTDQEISVIEKNIFKRSRYPPLIILLHTPQIHKCGGGISANDFDGYVLGPDYFERLHPESKKVPDEQERSDVIYAVLKASKGLGTDSLNVWSFIMGYTGPKWEGGDCMNILGFNFQVQLLRWYVWRRILHTGFESQVSALDDDWAAPSPARSLPW